MRIDDLMLQFRWQQQQQAIARGEPPPEEKPLTFDALQELIQKPHLSAAEAVLLSQMLEELQREPAPTAQLDAARVRALGEALERRRAELRLTATPDERLREYAPGPPTPQRAEGPVLPLHGDILGAELDGLKKAND
ncbi:MAG: hypothetical protein JXR83_20365 [Deltaproteobacteria bacterium]|nr:hypothetical protein [Deltaproteobacteria bacterium]